jgi:PAS domain S-box-containing protein
MLDYLTRLLDTSDFVPRRRCGVWTPELIWLHVGSDLLIWLAYLTIPFLLVYLTRRRGDLPFPWMFLMFCAFIITCGFTHLFDAMAFLWPAYRMMGIAKLVTAVVSWATVIGLIPLIPLVLALKSPLELQREIDERKRAEQVLVKQARLLNVTHDSIMTRDMNGTIRFFNHGAERRYGWSSTEAVGQTSHSLLQTRFPEPLAEINAKLARDGVWEGELVHRQRDGGRLVVASRWVLERDERGEPISVLEINNDITARKQAEEALLRKDHYLRLLIEGVQDYAIFMLDTQGFIASWNSGAERIKGYQAEEVIGTHFSRFHPPESEEPDKPAREMRIAAEDGRYEEEGWRIRKDGSAFWASVILTPLRDSTAQLTGFAMIVRDVTGRKRAEEEAEARKQRQHVMELEAANKELEAFSYSVSHDLRAPLRAIDGFSRILIEDYGIAFSRDAMEYLHLVRSNAQQMGNLVDALLAFARLNRQPISRQSVDFNRLVRKCLDKLRDDHEGRCIELSVGELPAANVEPMLLEQVWMNLIGNAIKYTRYREVTRIEIGVLASNGGQAEPVYFVKDNGVGFDMRYINKLFGVFQRLHRSEEFEGTGVGLATVQRIVERHGGRVWAESELDKGATFFFSLGPGVPK